MEYEELEKLDTIEKIDEELKRVDEFVKQGRYDYFRTKHILWQWREGYNGRMIAKELERLEKLYVDKRHTR